MGTVRRGSIIHSNDRDINKKTRDTMEIVQTKHKSLMLNNIFLALMNGLNITLNWVKQKEKNRNEVFIAQMIEEREMIKVEDR